MSKETIEWLNNNTLIGYTDKRGAAWHATHGADSPNHYTGPVPVEDVRSRLFNWKPLEASIIVTATTDDGILVVPDETRKAILRPDTQSILGVFKSGYQIHDYDEWLIHNVESILDADLAIGSAGLLRGGAVAWVQIEMEDTIDVEGVKYRPFLTATTSLDGSIATTYFDGAQVTVCDNTLAIARATAEHEFKVKHSSQSLTKVTAVRDALQIMHGINEAFEAEVRELVATSVSERQWDAFLDRFVPMPEKPGRAMTLAEQKRDELNVLWTADERASQWHGTGWGVLAAANTWMHHFQAVRGVSREERNMERVVMGRVGDADAAVLGALEMALA